MLAIKSYASVVCVPQWLLLTLLVRLGACPPLVPFTSPAVFHAGFLLPDGAEESFAGRFLMGLNLFDLWQAVLLGIGMAVVTGAPRGGGPWPWCWCLGSSGPPWGPWPRRAPRRLRSSRGKTRHRNKVSLRV